MTTLNEKKAALTKTLLLDAARQLAETMEISEITFKLVSEKADISQRTMFRHFNTREEFLAAFAAREHGELGLPETPGSVELLSSYVGLLYQKFDAQPRRVIALLSTELLPHVVSTAAKARLDSLQGLLTETYPACSEREILKTAANLRYTMSASSWRYYRMNFGFDLAMSTECAQMIIGQSLDYLKTSDQL